jgi:hypothetical protein
VVSHYGVDGSGVSNNLERKNFVKKTSVNLVQSKKPTLKVVVALKHFLYFALFKVLTRQKR